jgi:hypothetical protein
LPDFRPEPPEITTGTVTGDDPWRIGSGSRRRVGFLLRFSWVSSPTVLSALPISLLYVSAIQGGEKKHGKGKKGFGSWFSGFVGSRVISISLPLMVSVSLSLTLGLSLSRLPCSLLGEEQLGFSPSALLSDSLSLCFPPSHRLSLSHSVSFVSQNEESKEGMRKKEKGEERKKEEVRVSEGE